MVKISEKKWRKINFQGYKNKLREAYLKRRLTWVSDAMKFLKIKKSKTVDFQKLECEELIDLICPNDKILMYTTTTRNGYRQYKSDPKDCKDCPLRNKCTKSKNMTKVIERHLWEEFREYADEIRHTMEWKEIYPQRKETIERVFADCKENNGLRFTRLKGLKKGRLQSCP